MSVLVSDGLASSSSLICGSTGRIPYNVSVEGQVALVGYERGVGLLVWEGKRKGGEVG